MCKNILDKEFGLNDWYHKMKLYYIYIATMPLALLQENMAIIKQLLGVW